MKIVGIYVIQNPIGQLYVGQSRHLNQRAESHRCGSARNQPKLQESFDVYGPVNHEVVLVKEMSDSCSDLELDSAEEHYLEMLKYCGFGILNSRGAGSRGTHSDEARAKISASKRGVSVGPLSAETKAKISESQIRRFLNPEARAALSAAQMGRVVSTETRQKLRIANQGKVLSKATRIAISESKKGSKASPETKLKMSAIRKGKKLSNETRKRMKQAWVLRKLKAK